MKKQDFLSKVVPGAKRTYENYGIFPSITIAQAINESGWGGSNVAKADNNLFGIKYPGNHDPGLRISQGSPANDGGVYTRYQSWGDSILDHGYFLKNNPRYTKAGVFSAKTPKEQIMAIKAAGYAGDADYITVTMQIINDNNLTQYDTGTYTGGDSANLMGQPGLTIESTNYQIVKGSEKTGDYLFGRRYRIVVADSKGNALEVSQLHCLFSIIKTIQMEPNTSEVTIYNLNAQTENSIILSGKRITIEAGYEGSQFGLIFDGDILQCIREKEDATTYKLTIIALDSDRAINFDIANFSIARGQTTRSMVEHIVNKAENPISIGSISDKLSSQTLTRGKVFFGKSSDYLRQISKSNAMQYYMDNGSLNLISIEELPKDEIFDLSPKSGLVGTPEQTDYGISGQCLLNPQIKLNTLIHIDNSLVRAKRIDVTGSSTVPNSVNGNINLSTRDKIIAEAKQICDDPNVRYSMDYRGQTIGGITYWDCSSFVKHCYKVAGLEFVDIASNQYLETERRGKFISQSEAIPGDLVFWGIGKDCYHIAIYAGNGYIYAAAGNEGIAPKDQVLHQKLYGKYRIGRPKVLIDADSGTLPSSNNVSTSTEDTQTLIRSLDKDGIYRVIKLEYIGDTRGNDWYLKFDTITQLGGAIPAVAN